MTDLDTLRRQAAEQDAQIAARGWLTTSDLAARWNVGARQVRAIPRTALPYLLFGERTRRYRPEDVDAYENTRKPAEDHAA